MMYTTIYVSTQPNQDMSMAGFYLLSATILALLMMPSVDAFGVMDHGGGMSRNTKIALDILCGALVLIFGSCSMIFMPRTIADVCDHFRKRHRANETENAYIHV